MLLDLIAQTIGTYLSRLNGKAFGIGQWPIAEHGGQCADIVFEQGAYLDGVHHVGQVQCLCFAHATHDVARCEVVRRFES